MVPPKRIKILPEERKLIKRLFVTGRYSKRYLSKLFGISRRSVSLITDPSKLEAIKKRSSENWRKYHDPEKKKVYKREKRQRDKEEKEGKLRRKTFEITFIAPEDIEPQTKTLLGRTKREVETYFKTKGYFVQNIKQVKAKKNG